LLIFSFGLYYSLMKKVDTPLRSWTKSFTWRFIGILILFPLTYAFTKRWESATAVTFSFHILRMILYYFHERFWERISWGRKAEKNRFPFYFSLAMLVILVLIILIVLKKTA
jgi:uncharacterized membrane protein